MTLPQPMTTAARTDVLRDFLVFQLKLVLDGLKDLVTIKLSLLAVVVDLLSGGGRRPRLLYSVVRLSERFDRWLDLNRVGGAEGAVHHPEVR